MYITVVSLTITVRFMASQVVLPLAIFYEVIEHSKINSGTISQPDFCVIFGYSAVFVIFIR